jgi:hypothetical protein
VTRLVFHYMTVKARGLEYVYGTVEALAREFNLPVKDVDVALRRLGEPDPRSTSPDEEGRRVIAEPGNRWRVVNSLKYAMRETREAQRKYWRDKKAQLRAEAKAPGGTSLCPGHVQDSPRKSSMSREGEVEEQGEGKEQKRETLRAGVRNSRSRRRVSYPDVFETWFATYRTGTGRGTTKAEALTEYHKLSDEDREALDQRTAAWLNCRTAAKAAGIFVPEAPDPVRFLKHCRWEDVFDVPSAGGGQPTENEKFAAELAKHGNDPLWPGYSEAIVAGAVPVGFESFVRSRGVQP